MYSHRWLLQPGLPCLAESCTKPNINVRCNARIEQFAVLQRFNPLSKPAPPAIRSLLQRLKPITVKVLRPISRSYTEQQFLACMESTAPSPVPDTFDSDDLLKQFDQLQSNKPDIVAQAMELASIPTDMNNNSDILSKAMEMSDITSDIMMEL